MKMLKCFCGGAPEHNWYHKDLYHQIRCLECGVEVCYPGAVHETAVAWERWNKAMSKQSSTRGNGWQPIDTAPKDGSVFLLRRKGFRPKLAIWSEVSGRFLFEDRWQNFSIDEKTFWMPIPELPDA